MQDMSEIPCGVLELLEVIGQYIQYSQSAKQDKVESTFIMQLVIDEDRTMTKPRIVRSVNPILRANAALRE